MELSFSNSVHSPEKNGFLYFEHRYIIHGEQQNVAAIEDSKMMQQLTELPKCEIHIHFKKTY